MPAAAIGAGAVDAADPGDADARAQGKLGRGAIDDLADDLMAGNRAGCRSGGSSPSTMCRSVRQTPQARTRSSTWPGCNCGIGASPI